MNFKHKGVKRMKQIVTVILILFILLMILPLTMERVPYSVRRDGPRTGAELMWDAAAYHWYGIFPSSPCEGLDFSEME